ncbi:MAG TPA: hypothetical protein VGG89_12995 [Candidatus Baltobacteraceae bacterium]
MLKRRLLTLCTLVLLTCQPHLAFADSSASPAPKGTPPPQIYRVVTTPLCAKLRDHVRPAVAMILENDKTIAKSPPLFARYARGAFSAQDKGAANFSNGAPGPDSAYNQSPETSMALQKMSYLVSPIAQNIISAQKLLTAAEMTEPTGNPTDDKKLQQIKSQLMETIAYQNASLDLINGFVATQQMGELQHAGQEYIADLSQTDISATKPLISVTPGPLQDPNAPGIQQSPYDVDLAAIPGLAVGYNPLTRIVDGLHWVQAETAKRENAAGTSITNVLSECNK